MLEGTSSLVGSVSPFRAAVAGLVVLVAGVGAYGIHEHNVSKQLAKQNTTLNASLNATRDELNAVSSRVDALNAQVAAEKPAPEPTVDRKPMPR